MTVFVFASALLIFWLKIHFKQIISIYLSNAYSLISHYEFTPDLPGRILRLEEFNFNGDFLILMRKFNRILDQIHQNLLSSQFIDFDVTITQAQLPEAQLDFVCQCFEA